MKPSETQNQGDSANAVDIDHWRQEVTEFLSNFRRELDQLKTDLEIEREFCAECADSSQ